MQHAGRQTLVDPFDARERLRVAYVRLPGQPARQARKVELVERGDTYARSHCQTRVEFPGIEQARADALREFERLGQLQFGG